MMHAHAQIAAPRLTRSAGRTASAGWPTCRAECLKAGCHPDACTGGMVGWGSLLSVAEKQQRATCNVRCAATLVHSFQGQPSALTGFPAESPWREHTHRPCGGVFFGGSRPACQSANCETGPARSAVACIPAALLERRAAASPAGDCVPAACRQACGAKNTACC